MQTLLSRAHVWPGGIPPAVRLHPDSELDEVDVPEEIKGRCLFSKEAWTPSSDPEADRIQRRTLVEKWARADQSFLITFVCTTSGHHRFTWRMGVERVCLVDKPYDPENYSRITKLLMLLYIHLQNTVSHPLSYNPESFALNGQVACQTRIVPFHLGPLTSLRYALGHSWSKLMDERPEADLYVNKPIDLHPPLLEIMAALGQRGDLQSFSDYAPAEWAEEFERFAPGYLQCEQQGRVDQYGWDHLVDVSKDPFITYNHLRNARRLAALQGRSSA
ncbi:hypothetical protein ASPACDRAFT_1857579 [Aspergillus aculeatus ATCC 16872]|uniref:Uncharacterized protein n=1 Tax=Aspergillus aculeatus (strain ATCC 16872 / CBS 172.66 / WB 5094) TaxID=690307 RepID=A0A1L9WQ16_ASPA1|nr:uncharacterized protein ASPACDRAFT_1857579 [Aspergillus aculeatus ATCC 16872]OJJ98251.1 hypothetical protein ASPACDRAFT_1857579 [Aspergillus aculeatus ATCC 16872]